MVKRAKNTISNIYAADTEFTTKQIPSVAYLCGYAPVGKSPDVHSIKYFHGNQAIAEMVLDWFANCPPSSIIFFHNLKADYSYIFYTLKNNHLFQNLKIDESIFGLQKTIMQVSMTWRGKTIFLRDSFILFYAPLKKVMQGYNQIYKEKGKAVSLTRKEFYYEYVPDVIDIRFFTYFCKDVLGLAEALAYRWEMGRQKLTTSSDGWAILKETVNKEFPDRRNPFNNWFFPNLDRKLDKKLRPWYKGGFCYVNKQYAGEIVEGDICVYDVNSMYPWAMEFMRLPYGKPILVPPENYDKVINSDKLFLIEVVVKWAEVKDNKIGWVNNGVKNSYLSAEYVDSIGRYQARQFRTLHFTSLEWELFKETYNYQLERIEKVWSFHSSNKLFKPFCEYLYAQKAEAKATHNEALYQGVKRLLTTPSGKAGQNPESKAYESYLEDNIQRFREKVPTEEDLSRPAKYLPVSIFITSWGRCKLIRKINAVGMDKFLYCDTDSVHTLGDCDYAFEGELSPDKIGDWDKEAVWQRARYIRTKRYFHQTGDKHEFKCAGIPAKFAQDIKTCEDYYEGRAVQCLRFEMVQGGLQPIPRVITI